MVQGDFSTLNPTILIFLKLDVFYLDPGYQHQTIPNPEESEGKQIVQDMAYSGRLFFFTATVPH